MRRAIWLDCEDRPRMRRLIGALYRLGHPGIADVARRFRIGGKPRTAAELYYAIQDLPDRALNQLPIWANRASRLPATPMENEMINVLSHTPKAARPPRDLTEAEEADLLKFMRNERAREIANSWDAAFAVAVQTGPGPDGAAPKPADAEATPAAAADANHGWGAAFARFGAPATKEEDR